MRLFLTLKTAFESLYANKTRSGLTILGIVIGISSILLIVSIGSGAQGLILSQIGGFGADLIVIRPGREPQGPTDLAQTIFADSLKKKDVAALSRKSNVPDLIGIAPAVIVPGSVSHGSETYRPQIFGWSAEFLSALFNVYPSEGVLFSENDIERKADVAVIGSKVKKELFGESEALGKSIRIKGHNFRIVGIFPSKGQVTVFNIDDVVIIPYSAAQAYLLGTDHYNEVMVRASSPEAVPRTVQDIELTLREAHRITDPSKDDFYVVTQEGLVAQIGTILSALTAFLSSVVAISLVVGGIGVMNIMLVSVTERTREIGLRKAVGATDSDILRQFLFEAVLLTGFGGVIGVALGFAFSYAVAVLLSYGLGVEWGFSFPIIGVVLGVGVSAAVGLIFGIYPARQASRKNPIEALRYE